MEMTRRGFLQSSISTTTGVAAMGALASLGAAAVAKQVASGAELSLPALMTSPSSAPVGPALPPLDGPLVAYIHDTTLGEISLMVGTREITLSDPDLVTRLLRAAR